MANPISRCCLTPSWVERALARVAQFDDEEPVVPTSEEFGREVEQAVAEVPFRDITRFVNMSDWGKGGGRRPVSLPQGVKNRAGKAVYEATKGYHGAIPANAILSALAKHGLAAVDDDGMKWQGMLAGSAECGSEEAKGQSTRARIVTSDAEGRWSLTNTWMSLSYCRMPSGRYEVTCYLS